MAAWHCGVRLGVHEAHNARRRLASDGGLGSLRPAAVLKCASASDVTGGGVSTLHSATGAVTVTGAALCGITSVGRACWHLQPSSLGPQQMSHCAHGTPASLRCYSIAAALCSLHPLDAARPLQRPRPRPFRPRPLRPVPRAAAPTLLAGTSLSAGVARWLRCRHARWRSRSGFDGYLMEGKPSGVGVG